MCKEVDYWDCHLWDEIGYPGEFVHGDDVYVDDEYMGERWLPIKDCPEGYWVSDLARVWSNKTNRFRYPGKGDNDGHLSIDLSINGKRKHKYIHKAMAESFISNPNNYKIVRHLDDDPSNNVLENLQWGTNADNTHDSIRNGTFKIPTDEIREKAMKACRKPVIATNIQTGIISQYDGVAIAARELGICRTSVSKVLLGQRDSTGGYRFKYENEECRNE